ncbi:calmodulin-binding protein 25-like [Miscanthus floridulus]|uniref:calmodulin-binding protein 25-like n=1 Tax=Miscanthus floridulus TaxID=154761 RepID=UPI003457CC53
MDAISCLAPPPAALLATSYTDAAIARALHFSTTTTMSPDSSASASSSSSSLSHHHHSPLLSALTDLPSPYYVPPPVPPHAVAATCCDSVLVSDSPRRRSSPPAGARAGKRRSRASKRAPTTYISTDPANFRLVVQQITGVQADASSAGDDVSGVEVMMLQMQATATLDAAALLGAAAAGNPQLLPAGDEASALRQHQLQQQQPCFPTLDSWNVMYETNSAEML